MLANYEGYYDGVRTHLALDKDAPLRRPPQTVGEITSIPSARRPPLSMHSDGVIGRHNVRWRRFGRYSRLVGSALLSLRDPKPSMAVDLRLKDGPTGVTWSARSRIADLSGASLKLRFAGPDMSLLEKLVGLPIPKTPDDQATGDPRLRGNDHVQFEKLRRAAWQQR